MPQSIPETKRCYKCGNVYPRTKEYWSCDKTKKDGLQAKCKACASVCYRKWLNENLESVLARNKKWNKAHPDSVRATQKKWDAKNPGRRLAIIREWNKNNPEKKRAAFHRRKARLSNTECTLTPQEWENILADYEYQCAYCPKTWADGKLTQDHVVPVTQGGGYVKENIVPACKSCNSRKKDRTPEQAGMKLRIKSMV